jgi:putative Mg2+ transporter-C (MgtC) family protein
MRPECVGIGSVPAMLARLGAAFVFALPLAWERETGTHAHAGIRTIPLVSLGACAYMLLAEHLVEEPEARTRVIQGLLAGIGFIGGGAIFKQAGDVTGIATAATIWNMGAIGAATGYGDYWLGSLLCIASILVLAFGRLVHRIESALRKKKEDRH